MKNLTNDLKRILTVLAYQDDDYPPTGQLTTLSELNEQSNPGLNPNTTSHKRVAVIGNGWKTTSALNYALQTCLRLSARLDVLSHGSADPAVLTVAEQQANQLKVGYQHVALPDNAAEGILDYIRDHLSLTHIVALQEDPVIRELIDKVLPTKESRLPVPLVLVEDNGPALHFSDASSM